MTVALVFASVACNCTDAAVTSMVCLVEPTVREASARTEAAAFSVMPLRAADAKPSFPKLALYWPAGRFGMV